MTDQHRHKHEADGVHECSTVPSALLVELREHVPFSVSAVAIGLIVAGTICVLGFGGSSARHETGAVVEHSHEHGPIESEHHDLSHREYAGEDQGSGDLHGHAVTSPAVRLFHLFHPAHMLFSGAATAAMFIRYERKKLKALLVGLIGAIGVCGISDIAMPHASLLLLGAPAPFHLCVVDHPMLVLPFAVVGVLLGIGAASGVHQSTIISHTIHVFVSTMASIFYMVGPLGLVAWIDQIGQVFVFVVLAVMVPCCLSDIVFPMFMSNTGRKLYEQEPHAH